MSDTLKTTGAPSALTYIGQKEAAARVELEASELILREALAEQLDPPPAKDGIDWDNRVKVATQQRDWAFERWEEWAKKLHMFDKSVAPEKREASEKMSRDEVTNLLAMVQITFRAGMEGLIVTFCDDVLSCKNQAEVYKLTADKIRDCLRNAFDSAKRNEDIPEWCEKAMEVK